LANKSRVVRNLSQTVCSQRHCKPSAVCDEPSVNEIIYTCVRKQQGPRRWQPSTWTASGRLAAEPATTSRTLTVLGRLLPVSCLYLFCSFFSLPFFPPLDLATDLGDCCKLPHPTEIQTCPWEKCAYVSVSR